MLIQLVLEFFGTFVWTFASLMVYEAQDRAQNGEKSTIAFAQASVDFFVIISFYLASGRVRECYLNPIIAIGSFLLGRKEFSEVL